jgi:hypothetical protein
MKSILYLLIMAFIATGPLVYGQTAEIRDVRKNEFRGVYPIINKMTKVPQGYYTFYVNEKEGDGMVNFIIAIYDLELKLIKQTPISITKNSTVDGSEYNGEDFLFVFNDVRKKAITYVTVDTKGDIIKRRDIIAEKMAAATADVYPSNNSGFYIVKPIKEKKWGYSVERVNRNLETQWEKRFMPEKGFVTVDAVESDEDKIIIIQNVRPAITSSKAKAEFVCLSDATGDLLFNYSLFDGASTAQPSAFLIDKDKNIITGGMYFEGERLDGVNSDGIFFLKLSPKGEKMAYSKIDWDNGIQEVLQKSKKGISISSKPKVYFQDIAQGSDGGYQVISETFQKNIQMVSVPLKDLISGRFMGCMNCDDSKPVTFEVMDFMFFNFDKEGKLANMNLIEKEHTKVSVYYPYNRNGGLAMAKWVDKLGWFNYAFVTDLPSGERLLVSSNFAYADAYIGLNTIKAGEVSQMEKIPVDKRSAKGGQLQCMRSNPGSLCISLFDKKEQIVYLYKQPLKTK